MNQKIYEAILERIESMPVLDSHEHFVPDAERDFGADLLEECAGQYVGHDLRSAGMPEEEFKILSDRNKPLEQRAELFFRWYPEIRFTGYGRSLAAAVQELFGEELTPDTIQTLTDAFRKTSEPGWCERYLSQNCGIKKSIVDWMPLAWRFDSGFYVQAYDFIFLLMPEGVRRFTVIEEYSGIRIRDFDSYLAACEAVIRKKAEEQGVRILKLPIAYHRKLAFPMPEKREAEREFNEEYEAFVSFRGGICTGASFDRRIDFQNYVLHRILKTAEGYGMVIQFHTGYLAGNAGYLPDSDPSEMGPLFFRYPKLKFDLFHISYPYYPAAGALAKAYPNVYLNMCWAHMLSPNASVQALNEWLDIVPCNKIIGFGGDVRTPQFVPGQLVMARENIARCLAGKVENGVMTQKDAAEIAEKLLWRNGEELYHIAPPDKPRSSY